MIVAPFLLKKDAEMCQLLLQICHSSLLIILTFIIICGQIIFIITGIPLFIKVKQLSIMTLEQAHHSSIRTPNHLHVHRNLDLVWLKISQITVDSLITHTPRESPRGMGY
jgi:hypothetical protein